MVFLPFLPVPKVTKRHRTARRRRDKLPNPLSGGIFSLERRNVLRGSACTHVTVVRPPRPPSQDRLWAATHHNPQTAKSLPLLPAAYTILSWPGPPHTSCESTIGAATCAARSSSVLARSYIPRLRVFNRLICPSCRPLLQRSASTFPTMWAAPPRQHQSATEWDLPIPTTSMIYHRPSNSTRQTSSCSREGFSSLGRRFRKKRLTALLQCAFAHPAKSCVV